jgi:hypothetical protein
MEAVGRVQFEPACRCLWLDFDFVHITRTKSRAGRPVGIIALIDAKIRVVDDNVAGLIFSVHGFGEINTGQFVYI